MILKKIQGAFGLIYVTVVIFYSVMNCILNDRPLLLCESKWTHKKDC